MLYRLNNPVLVFSYLEYLKKNSKLMTNSTDQLEISPVVIMIAPLGIETENERVDDIDCHMIIVPLLGIFTLPEHLNASPFLVGVVFSNIKLSLLYFVDYCFSFSLFSFGHFIVPFSYHHFWLHLWNLQSFILGWTVTSPVIWLKGLFVFIDL